MTAGELDALDSSNIGGGLTCGSGIVAGTTVAGSALKIENGGGIIIGSGITMNGKIIGVSSIIATGAIDGGDIIGDDFKGVNSNFTGISTLGQANCTTLEVGGSLNVLGVGTISTGVIKVDGTTGIISAQSFISPTGVSTFANLRVTSGQDTRIFGKYIGFSTTTPVITEGIEVYQPQSEIFVDGYSSGIGIGTTSGDRLNTAKLYVGYSRDAAGALADTASIFECGTIGIGTTASSVQGTSWENVEVYRNVKLFGENTGKGGGVGNTSVISIGFNTTDPGGALDMRYAGGAFCLPVATTVQGGSPFAYFHSQGDTLGNLWLDKVNMKVTVALGDGNGSFVGLRSETYGKQEVMDSFVGVRGYGGPIVNSDAHRDTSPTVVPSKPVEEPVGWNTSNVVYYLPTDQFQYRTSDYKWKTQVSSAQTGTEIIIDGTTAILNVVGVGSISLGTLS